MCNLKLKSDADSDLLPAVCSYIALFVASTILMAPVRPLCHIPCRAVQAWMLSLNAGHYVRG